MLLFLLWMSRPLLQAGHQGKTPKERHGKEREKKKAQQHSLLFVFFFQFGKAIATMPSPIMSCTVCVRLHSSLRLTPDCCWRCSLCMVIEADVVFSMSSPSLAAR